MLTWPRHDEITSKTYWVTFWATLSTCIHSSKPFIIRPPGTISSGRAYVLPVMYLLSFFFLFRHSFSELPPPIALKLCHMVGIWLNFIIPLQKFGGALPKKNLGPKTCKISVNFGPLQTLIANISGTAEDIQNGRRYKLWQFLLRQREKVPWTLVH